MKIEWKQCFKIGVSIFILFLCINYWSVAGHIISVFFSSMTPILMGCAFAYLVNILMCSFERRYFPKSKKEIVAKSRRPVCMIVSIVSVLGVVVLLIWMIIPELINCIETFVGTLPDLVRYISKNEYVKMLVSPETLDSLKNMEWESYMEKIGSFLFSGVGGAVNTVAELASSVVSVAVTVAFGVIFAFYFLTGKERMIGQCKRVMNVLLKDKMYSRIMHYLKVFDECFHGYIAGKMIDAVILGGMCMIIMFICRLPYAVMIGTLIGFTALIPVVGAYAGAIVGALMILTESPMKALLFLVVIIVVQMIEGNVIYPKIMGNSLGLPGIWVLAAVTLGGSLFGILGMLIGVPIFAGIYKIAGESIRKREGK